ncbi:hypothetical protein L083_1131 [Actinoplanes sp. N902-109]|nr:hypothetical protein L083_1131 [Actinoplanes sp. N902-109]
MAVNNFGDTRSGGLAGPMGLFIIVLLSIATVLLIRNMNKRLRRLPDRFPDPADVTRDAEVARLEADLAKSDGAAGPGVATADRSDLDSAGKDAEVANVESANTATTDGERRNRS